jgi:serine phosphatase RsbU (regulator of sigma subunit)
MITAEYESNHEEMLRINEHLVIAGIRQQELAEAARRAEQRLTDIVYGLDVVISEVEVRTGRTAFLSLRAETFLGYPSSYWQAQPDFLAAIIHPRDRERAAALLPSSAVGQDYEYEFRALSADTDFVWLRNIVRLVRDSEGNAELLRCVILDVTLQKQAALALEAAYARERSIAETLQRSLLFMPPEDSFPGLAVRTLYEAASDEAMVGGDLWDTFACDHGHVALVIGDVMGHGLPAAVLTAELKYTLRGFVREHEQPARIMAQMNAYLCESHRLFREGLNAEGDDAPVCLIVVILDAATGKGAVAAVGMEPPLLARADGRIEEVRVSGLLLGIQPDQTYESAPFDLGHGDTIFMATDGITETRRGKEFLGADGLARLAREAIPLGNLELTAQSILAGARAFGGGAFRDDVCLLLARRL